MNLKLSTTDSPMDNPDSDLEFINRNYNYDGCGLGIVVGDKSDQKISKRDSFLSRVNLFSAFNRYVTAGIKFRGAVVRLINYLYEGKEIQSQLHKDDFQLLVGGLLDERLKGINSEMIQMKEKIVSLEIESSSANELLKQLDSVTRGLETIISMEFSRQKQPESPDMKSVSNELDYSYLLLENRYRGSETEILERMKPYADFIKGAVSNLDPESEVIEIGCGRGELLSLLKDQHIKARGLELDEAMCERCKAKGLNVFPDDPLVYISSLPDASVNGVIAIQVVEHLEIKYRKSLFSLLRQKIRPGGFLVFETINTSSFVPLLQNYFRDPTHTTPLHPDTLCTLLEQAGFLIREIKYSSEYPDEAKIPLLPKPEGMPFRHQELIRHLNERFTHLNRLLYGPQDYAIFAGCSNDWKVNG